ncbi:unnamed protein product [Orchesella dallaii]|uniref:Chitin-binding type-2 domain-containing protein n=1 Tax=Orchesella dallaii TaxID=48710 RepID=A0ABP1RFW0_9HEXA
MISTRTLVFATIVAYTSAAYLLPDTQFFVRHCIGPGCPDVSYPEPVVKSTKDSINCTNTEDSVLSDPLDCQNYIVCHNGTAHKLSCTVGYAFHPKLKLCVQETLVKSCGKIYCPPTVLIGVVPDPKNCTRYYRCMYGIPLHYQCGKGYFYDQEFGRCRKYGGNPPECLEGVGQTTGSTEAPIETTTPSVTSSTDSSSEEPEAEDTTPAAPPAPESESTVAPIQSSEE